MAEMRDGLLTPRSLEAPEPPMHEAMEKERTGGVPRGTPPGYTGPDQRCEYCKHFQEFAEVTCAKYAYDADPDGHCESFEERPETQSEENVDGKPSKYGMMRGEEGESE